MYKNCFYDTVLTSAIRRLSVGFGKNKLLLNVRKNTQILALVFVCEVKGYRLYGRTVE